MRSRSRTPGRALPDPAALPAAAFIVVLLVAGLHSSPTFLSRFNVSNVLTQVTPLLLVAAGQTFVVAAGGIDLSVGSIVSLVSVVSAVSFEPLGIPLAVVIAVACALLAGLGNGLLVARGLDPFLATLGTLSVIQGVTFTVLSSPGGTIPQSFGNLAGYFAGGALPNALPIAVVVVGCAIVVLRRSRMGMDLLSTGDDARVARLCGVRVARARVAAFVLSAACGSLAGLFLNARTLGGDPLAGANFTLDSIAAVVLGGSALTGGRVTVLGSCLGALALGLLANVLNFSQVSGFYQIVVKGALVVAAVVLPAVAVRVARRVRDRRLTRDAVRGDQRAPDALTEMPLT